MSDTLIAAYRKVLEGGNGLLANIDEMMAETDWVATPGGGIMKYGPVGTLTVTPESIVFVSLSRRVEIWL
jgi:hypothetical protein